LAGPPPTLTKKEICPVLTGTLHFHCPSFTQEQDSCLTSFGCFVWLVYSVQQNPIDAIPDLSENQVIVLQNGWEEVRRS
jgi:hypothetical protein